MNLRLLQLGDSALPIGGYSQSWGLEAAVECGLVHDAASLETWVSAWLRHAVAPLEGVVVAAVCRASSQGDWSRVCEANDLLEAVLTPPSLRHASAHMGGRLLALAECWPWAAAHVQRLREVTTQSVWHHAVVFAVLAAASGAEPAEAVLVYLHQTALGVIGAGVKAVPIGHTHGQQILARLHDEVERLAADVAERDLDAAGSFCPRYEVLCDAQTRLYTRLFRS